MADPTGLEIGRVRRLALGDVLDTTLTADDITDIFANEGEGSVLLTAALACEMLAARFGRTNFRWTADGQSVDKTMQAGELRARAAQLRQRYYASQSGQITLSRSVAVADGPEF